MNDGNTTANKWATQIMDVSNQIWLFYLFFTFLFIDWVLVKEKKVPVLQKQPQSSKTFCSTQKCHTWPKTVVRAISYFLLSYQSQLHETETLRLISSWTSQHILFCCLRYIIEKSKLRNIIHMKRYMQRKCVSSAPLLIRNWASDSLKSWRK
jgi:hypothetical protein